MRISDWSSDVCSSDLRGADAAATEYRDARPGFDLRGVERRTDAGQDRAPDERGAIERNILVDLHHRPFGQEHELGETAKIGERDQLLAVRRQARRRPFGSPRGGAHAIEAQMRPAIEALLAGATIDGGERDDMNAGLTTTGAASWRERVFK